MLRGSRAPLPTGQRPAPSERAPRRWLLRRRGCLSRRMQGRCRVTLAALLSSLGALLFGLDIGYIAPILECASFKRDVAHLLDWQDPDSKLDSASAGFVVGIFSLGAIAVSFPPVSSYFLDEWGRKGSILVGSAIFLTGSLLQARATSLAQILLGRLAAGCSIGLLSTTVPLYQSEVAPPALRGGLTSLYQLMITLGILIAAAVDVPLVPIDGGWRIAICMQAIPALSLLAGMLVLPRSPRWLVQRGRVEEALEVLESLREEAEARAELKEITMSYEEARAQGDVAWREAFTGRVGQLLAVGVALQLLQQLVGMNAFMYFGPRLFRTLGLSENVFQTINNLVNFVSTIPALFLADSCGRRSLLIAGAVGMTVACFAMGLLGQLCMTHTPEGGFSSPGPMVQGAIVLMVFNFVINFAYGWGPIVWVYCAEIFPLRNRSWCLGVTTMSNWVGNFIIAQFTPMMLESLGFGTFYVFGIFTVLSLGLAIWIPETKGVPLEEIDGLFDAKFGAKEPRGHPVGQMVGVVHHSDGLE